MEIILGLVGVIGVLFVALKIKSSALDKAKGELLNEETKGKSNVIDTKKDSIREKLKENDQALSKAKEEAKNKNAEDYWKGKI